LMNALCGAKIAIVSDKPQTTRTRITGVLTKDPYQMVFLDTPGLHKPRNRLGDFMVKVVNNTVTETDTVLLLVEPVARIGIPEQMLLDKLRQFELPAILVINKIDTVEKDRLLEVIALYSQQYDFLDVIPLSAKTGDGLALLEEALKKQCFDSPALFPEDMISDQPEKQIAAELIREKLLMLLDKEVPHGTAIEIEEFKERENSDIVDISAVIYCEKKSHKGIIIGSHGAMLKKIGALARGDLEEMLGCKVFLQLWVKVKEDWRNSAGLMRNFGYDGKDLL
ncbi:MAG: GTPase Era, partial [Ruminococcaceae bacterium]|nr:GTPase Era [Oscillospiraceae bacterium]